MFRRSRLRGRASIQDYRRAIEIFRDRTRLTPSEESRYSAATNSEHCQENLNYMGTRSGERCTFPAQGASKMTSAYPCSL
eukprot:6188846-Pleurochrysis_carterae.AAC.4